MIRKLINNQTIRGEIKRVEEQKEKDNNKAKEESVRKK
jgi:hypothetical protein